MGSLETLKYKKGQEPCASGISETLVKFKYTRCVKAIQANIDNLINPVERKRGKEYDKISGLS